MFDETNSVFTYSLADSLTQPVSFIQLVTRAGQPLILLLIHSIAYSLTYSLEHSFIHSNSQVKFQWSLFDLWMWSKFKGHWANWDPLNFNYIDLNVIKDQMSWSQPKGTTWNFGHKNHNLWDTIFWHYVTLIWPSYKRSWGRLRYYIWLPISCTRICLTD